MENNDLKEDKLPAVNVESLLTERIVENIFGMCSFSVNLTNSCYTCAVRTCYCATTPEHGRQLQAYEAACVLSEKSKDAPKLPALPQPPAADVVYNLDARHKLHIPGFVRELVCEIMFTLDNDNSCLTQIICELLLKV
jgi:hypothetical protein